jgi:hydrogenase maturation factor
MLAIALKALNIGKGQEKAAIVGEEPARMVLMHTGFGGTRMIDMLVGDPLPGSVDWCVSSKHSTNGRDEYWR